MRKTPWLLAEPYRYQVPDYESSRYGDSFGWFLIWFGRTGVRLRCLAQDGRNGRAERGDAYAWDHVSVSLKNRCPNWLEMSFIKSIFWDETETVMQLHVPAADHIDCHPYTLHLWRPLLHEIPRPPQGAV